MTFSGASADSLISVFLIIGLYLGLQILKK